MQVIIFHQGSPTSIEYFFAKSVQTEAKKQPGLHTFGENVAQRLNLNLSQIYQRSSTPSSSEMCYMQLPEHSRSWSWGYKTVWVSQSHQNLCFSVRPMHVTILRAAEQFGAWGEFHGKDFSIGCSFPHQMMGCGQWCLWSLRQPSVLF